MSPTAQNIANYINLYVRTYPKDAFDDMRLNFILLQMLALADANGGGSGPTSNNNQTFQYTSADFSSSTTVNDSQLLGLQYALFWNEAQRYLEMDAGEFSYVSGGGFTVNLAGFDSSAGDYHFVANILQVSSGNVIPLTSANFVNATDCPVATLFNKKIALFCNEFQRYLEFDAGEFVYLPGGGFSVTIPGFDKTSTNYHFYAFVI